MTDTRVNRQGTRQVAAAVAERCQGPAGGVGSKQVAGLLKPPAKASTGASESERGTREEGHKAGEMAR